MSVYVAETKSLEGEPSSLSRAGTVLEFFPPATEPDDPKLLAALEKALAAEG